MAKHPARQAFDAVERAIGRPLERAVSRPETSALLMTAGAVSLAGLRMVKTVRSEAVHLWGLPSHRDVHRVAVQLARLQRTANEIEQRLLEIERAEDR